MNIICALIFQSNFLITIWSFVVTYVVCLINKTPTPLLKNKSSFDILHDHSPNLNHLKIFECIVFVTTFCSSCDKLSSRTQK